MTEGWKVERVEIRTPEQRAAEPYSEPDGIPPDVVRVIAFGRMDDGRPFYNESWVTEAFLADFGEDKLREWIGASTHPPEPEDTPTQPPD